MNGTTEKPVGLTYFPKAQSEFKPPLIANENAFLGDVISSEKNDAVSPISCGFYRLEKGAPNICYPELGFVQICADSLTQAHRSYTHTPTTK